jgi:hypothetical protein
MISCLPAAKTIAIQLEALAGQRWPEPWEVPEETSNVICKRDARHYAAEPPHLREHDAVACQLMGGSGEDSARR